MPEDRQIHPLQWPADWDELYSGERCPLCEGVRDRDNDHALLVALGEWSDAWIDRQSGVLGYCVVIWTRGHAVELGDLDAADLAGFWEEVAAVGRAVTAAFSPKKINYQVLGNGLPHLHTHVVPRYDDDPAPGGPLPWDVVVAEAFTDAELREQRDRIVDALRGGTRPAP